MEVEPENVTGSYDAEATGTYRPCHGCQAPIRQPFPEDWTIEMIKEGPPTGPVRAFLTPHTAECTAPDANPQPGHVVRVPGRYVVDLIIDTWPPPTYRLGSGQVYVGPLPDEADLVGFAHIGHAEGWAVTDLTEGQPVQSANVDGQQFFKPVVPFDVNGHAEAPFELAADEVPDWLTDLGKDDPCPPTEQ